MAPFIMQAFESNLYIAHTYIINLQHSLFNYKVIKIIVQFTLCLQMQKLSINIVYEYNYQLFIL